MPTIYLALGSNLGDREANIKRAVLELKKHPITVTKISTVIETNPIDGPPQGKFLNAALEAQTDIPPEELLTLVKSIEKNLGREPTGRNGPRIIDIDILLYNHQKINSGSLTIPHPRMLERQFVMQPLLEIAPEILKEIPS